MAEGRRISSTELSNFALKNSFVLCDRSWLLGRGDSLKDVFHVYILGGKVFNFSDNSCVSDRLKNQTRTISWVVHGQWGENS